MDLEALIAQKIATNATLSGLSQHIRLQSEATGLRIELTDADTGSLFASGSANLSGLGSQIAGNIGEVLLPLPLAIKIEGHTDAFKTAPGAPSNWEISSARANNALTAFEEAGIAPDRFKSVTGLAATHPLLPNQPHAAVNRRISIVLELSE